MVQTIVFTAGSSYRQGVAHGLTAGHLAAENLKRFWTGLSYNGYQKKDIIRHALKSEDILEGRTREEISGIAAGANLSYEELLAFNLYHGLVLPEECTVMMAVGAASASGSTVFAKNSDKIGDESLVGDRFYKNKEINVILFCEAEDGGRIVGVSAAGSTGLKMGLNDKGVAAGTNISRTVELAQRKVDLTQMRAVDRAQLIRDGLEYGTALDAVSLVTKKVAENPMATPGNVEFAEARIAYIMEGSYDRVALKKVVDDIDSRSNCFVILKELNKPDDLSSICRYVRTQEMLKAIKGKATAADMKRISADHSNGPGPNSICRHGEDFREETTLAAAVMEINPDVPAKSRIHICMGKPCHSWSDPEANVTFEMDCGPKDIPQGFINGEVFKKFYTEEAKL